ncbi:hypothetical protein HT664_09285, partial [Ursidibacter maritimus]
STIEIKNAINKLNLENDIALKSLFNNKLFSNAEHFSLIEDKSSLYRKLLEISKETNSEIILIQEDFIDSDPPYLTKVNIAPNGISTQVCASIQWGDKKPFDLKSKTTKKSIKKDC